MTTEVWASPRSRRSPTSPGRPKPPPSNYAVGIDPGLGEAGVVLRRGDQVLEFGTTSDTYGPSFPTALRAQAIAARIVGRVIKWIEQHQISDLDVAVELPVYTSNADGFGKQYATVQAIEAALLEHAAPMLERMWVHEPHPSESKKAATGKGNATKVEIYSASPFIHMPRLIAGLKEDTILTLADAWAHSLTVERCERNFNGKMDWPSPKERIAFED